MATRAPFPSGAPPDYSTVRAGRRADAFATSMFAPHDRDAMAIIQPDFYQVLRSWGLPMRVVHEDPRRVLVRKP
jgi:hypothetical protein